MAFDPDAFLSSGQPEAEKTFDPDAFLSASGSVQAPQVQQAIAVPQTTQAPIQDPRLARTEAKFQELVGLGVPEKAARREAERLGAQDLEGQGEFIAGIPGMLPTLLGGAIAEPIAGIAGGVAALNPYAKEGAGARTVESVRSMVPSPMGEHAQGTARSLGKMLEPVSKLPRAAGELTQDITGSPLAATAVETGIAAIPELIGLKGGRSLSGPSRVSRDITIPDQVATAQRAAGDTGIDLFEGQQTLSGPALEAQSFVQQLPAGAQKASQSLLRQNEQAHSAVTNILNDIAPADSISVGPGAFRNAAQRSLDARRRIRSEQASPLYNEAFDGARSDNLKIDVTDIRDRVASVASEFPEAGKISKVLNRASEFLGENDLKKLHNAKIEIDDIISTRGDDAIGNTSRRELTILRNDLTERLAQASPKYEAARAKFAELSPAVTALDESIVGRVAGLSDTQLKTASRQIFDPETTNPTVIRDAKKVIDEVSPDAWNMLLRSEIERRMGTIKPEIGGSVENIPGKLSNAIFGNTKKREAILSGATGDTKKALESLDTALRRASLGRDRGSQTATRTEISSTLKGGVVSSLRDLFSKPLDTIVRVGENSQFDRRVAAMAEALFDPRYAAETSRMISTGKGRDLTRQILSVEALKASGREEKEAQDKQQ